MTTSTHVTARTRAARQRHTARTAERRMVSWSTLEDTELAHLASDDDIEDFALRHGRTFNAVLLRRHPRTTTRLAPADRGRE